MSSAPSLAEQYRAHRAAFELALELGCTPRKAAQILRDRERERRRSCGTQVPTATTHSEFKPISEQSSSFDDFDCNWMMRG